MVVVYTLKLKPLLNENQKTVHDIFFERLLSQVTKLCPCYIFGHFFKKNILGVVLKELLRK